MKAQEENPCRNKKNITAGCSSQQMIGNSMNITQDQNQYFNPLEYTHWLAGATVVSVVWALCWTLAGAVVIAVIHWFNEANKDEKKTKCKAGKGRKMKTADKADKDEKQK